MGILTMTPIGFYDWNRIEDVRAVHRLIRRAPYQHDLLNDRTPKLDGDCQRKSAWARDVLLIMGWPVDSMEIWDCKIENGHTVHEVLVLNVRGFNGQHLEVALDCRRDTPVLKDELPYSHWFMVTAPAPPGN